MTMKLEVVILTESRPQLISHTLNSLGLALQRLMVPSAQLKSDAVCRVRLCFNGARRDYIDFVHALIATSFKDLPSVEVETLETSRSLPGAARNLLLKNSTADWIFFCDDDVILPPEIFVNFFKVLTTAPDIHLAGGPNITPTIAMQSANERIQGALLGAATITGPMSRRYRLHGRPDQTLASEAATTSLTLCNLFWRRNADFLFPTDLICGEELPLVLNSNSIALVSESLFVEHFRRSKPNAFFIQAVKYGVGRGQISPLIRIGVLLGFLALAYTGIYDFRLIVGLVLAYGGYLFVACFQLKAHFPHEPFGTLGLFKTAPRLQIGYATGILATNFPFYSQALNWVLRH